MTTPFGPQLIGETEKTLGAILRQVLASTGLTEPEWVTLRIAGMLGDRGDTPSDADALAATVANRAHFTEAVLHVNELTGRGLLAEGQLTLAGHTLVDTTQERITAATAPVWNGLPVDDVVATTRLLNEVLTRARSVLA